MLRAKDLTPDQVVRAAVALGEAFSPRGGHRGGGGGGGDAARSPWSLQLHRALALRAHEGQGEAPGSPGAYSLEQMMVLARASLDTGVFHSLLFRDVVHRCG